MNKTTAKTISWLIVSGLIIFLADYAVTRHAWGSLLAAVGACALKTPFYSAHEVVFERTWSRTRKAKPCIPATALEASPACS